MQHILTISIDDDPDSEMTAEVWIIPEEHAEALRKNCRARYGEPISALVGRDLAQRIADDPGMVMTD